MLFSIAPFCLFTFAFYKIVCIIFLLDLSDKVVVVACKNRKSEGTAQKQFIVVLESFSEED